MIIFHCWNCFVGFNGLSYDAWAKCPHFFASWTTFGGLGGPWEPPIWPKLAKMGIAGYSYPWRPQIGGTAWILVGSRCNTSARVYPTLIQPWSTLIQPFGVSRTDYGPISPIYGNLGLFEPFWSPPMAMSERKKGSNTSAGVSPALIQPWSTLIQPFGVSRAAHSQKWQFWP